MTIEPYDKFDLSNSELVDATIAKSDFNIKSHWVFKLAGWLGFISTFPFYLWAISSQNLLGPEVVFAGCFGALPIFLLLMARQSIYIDQNKITIIRVIGRFEIRWNEINKIEFYKTLGRVVFYANNNKWLVLPKISTFVSSKKIGLTDYVKLQVSIRNIPLSIAQNTPEKSKNTMISLI